MYSPCAGLSRGEILPWEHTRSHESLHCNTYIDKHSAPSAISVTMTTRNIHRLSGLKQASNK